MEREAKAAQGAALHSVKRFASRQIRRSEIDHTQDTSSPVRLKAELGSNPPSTLSPGRMKVNNPREQERGALSLLRLPALGSIGDW